MQQKELEFRVFWLAGLACFVLAGSTGALFRFSLLYGPPAGLDLGNVRHAHSHLMYFSWVTPALMALIGSWLPRLTGCAFRRGLRWLIGLTIVLGLLAYPPFLLYGYTVAEIGKARLPLSMIAASANALTWYLFAALYARTTWGLVRSLALRLWDAGIGFLLLATAGAAGRGVLVALDVSDPFWQAATVHLFLDLFSDGWVMLALLGLLYAIYPTIKPSYTGLATRLIIIGLPVTFLLGVPVSLVPPTARLVAGVGGVLVAVGLLLHIRALWPHVASLWRVPLAFGALKALVQLGISIPPLAHWVERMSLRIPYLHWLLLGFVTLSLVAAAVETWPSILIRHYRWIVAAILLLQLSLLPLTGFWPAAWRGQWVLILAAWSALAPVVAAVGLLLTHKTGEST